MHVSRHTATYRSNIITLYRYRVQYDRPFMLVKCQTGNQAKIPQISLCLNPQRIEYVLLFFHLADATGGQS